MLLATDGYWFLETVDGRERSSGLGWLGPVESVQAWCEARGLKFEKLRSPALR